MKSQVGQWGNSLAIIIPKYIVQELNLRADDAVDFSVVDGKAVLSPVRSLPEFTLDELLEQVTEPPEAEVNWGKPVGEEIW